MDKKCETCKHYEKTLWEDPCKDCWIPDPNKPDVKDNDKWESFVPDWMVKKNDE